MPTGTTAYPFDPYGTQPSNRITAEFQPLSPPELSEFLFIIPEAAPFFAESLSIVHVPSMRTLVEGVDYMPTHLFHDASLACAKPIYGSITFFDNTLTGAGKLTYQTLGGDWVLTAQKIIDILSNKLVNPRRVTWEQVADLPYAFPPIDHDWHLDDMVGMKEVVEALDSILAAMQQSGDQGLATHIADKTNPHQVTKTQVGLSDVENLPVASIAEAQAGTAPNRYLTVLRGAQLVQALIGTTLDNHINNTANPHQTTKTHVGLGSVDNFATASQVEAEAGISPSKFMTPLRTAQAIAALASAPINTHIARTDNPHAVTQAQVGLSNVQNYAIADVVAARAGLSNVLYMTPAMTREAIETIALQGVSDHIADMSNPHNTTKGQVGLGNVDNYATATQVDAETGTALNLFMTPLRTAQAIAALIGDALTAHINDSANPHAVSKTQVGLANVQNYGTADNDQSVAGVASNLYMTPAGTKALILALGGGTGGGGDLAAHLADFNNPHEVSKDQIGLSLVDNFATATLIEAKAGTANDLFITPAGAAGLIGFLVGDALSAHLSDNDNPHNTTASQVGAYSQAQSDAALDLKLDKTGIAADTTLFSGHTFTDTMALAADVVNYPVDVNVSGLVWTLLGEYSFGTTAGDPPVADIMGLVTGGEPATYQRAATFEVHLTVSNLALSKVVVHSEIYSADVTFGYVVNTVGGDTTVSLYARGQAGRKPYAISPLSQDSKFFKNTNAVVQVEPVGITYLTLNLPPFTRELTRFGDLTFGVLPFVLNADQIAGSLVEWVSVANTDAEELDTQAVQADLRHEYGSFIPWSGYADLYLYKDLPILDAWGWNATIDGVLLDTATVDGSAFLAAQEAELNYTFEVELSSTDPAANGAGVIAAQVMVGDRPVAITVIRTPGGLVQAEPTKYKLKTVAIHVGQLDMTDVASANGSLQWSDTALPDDARDPALYNPVGHGWDTAGATRIKVVRAGNTLTIDVSDFGSTTYVPTEQVVIDLTSSAQFVAFADRPSRWGFASLKQPFVTFKVLNRPHFYLDYIRTGVPADNGKQRLYRYNGASWDMSYLGLSNPKVRPNRLYYSDWNGVLYQSQRNGRLRPILIEAYSRANPTVITA